MAALVEERIRVPTGSVQVFRAGGGDDVVYLHSASGEGAGTEFLERLADSFSVSAPMFPGFGDSEGIESIDDIEDAAFHLVDVLDALGLERPHLVGMSLGGWLAAELATRYPDRVGCLVLVNPAGLYLRGAEIKEIFGRPLDDLSRDLFADPEHPMALMMVQMEEMNRSRPAEIPFELVKPFFASLAATAKLAWNPYLHNPKLQGRLPRVRSRTLVVHGSSDGLIPRQHAETYARIVPGARLVDVEGGGHLLALEKPAELAALVDGHLAG